MGTIDSLYFCLVLRNFSCYWVALSSLYMRAFVLSYLSGFVVFVCCLLKACFFLKEKGKGVDLGESRGEGEMREVERRETSQNVLCERRIPRPWPGRF